jgi:hypothetical protein
VPTSWGPKTRLGVLTVTEARFGPANPRKRRNASRDLTHRRADGAWERPEVVLQRKDLLLICFPPFSAVSQSSLAEF